MYSYEFWYDVVELLNDNDFSPKVVAMRAHILYEEYIISIEKHETTKLVRSTANQLFYSNKPEATGYLERILINLPDITTFLEGGV